MRELQLILSVLGVLYLIDIIRKVFFNGAEKDKYEEERERRSPPRFGS